MYLLFSLLPSVTSAGYLSSAHFTGDCWYKDHKTNGFLRLHNNTLRSLCPLGCRHSWKAESDTKLQEKGHSSCPELKTDELGSRNLLTPLIQKWFNLCYWSRSTMPFAYLKMRCLGLSEKKINYYCNHSSWPCIMSSYYHMLVAQGTSSA